MERLIAPWIIRPTPVIKIGFPQYERVIFDVIPRLALSHLLLFHAYPFRIDDFTDCALLGRLRIHADGKGIVGDQDIWLCQDIYTNATLGLKRHDLAAFISVIAFF